MWAKELKLKGCKKIDSIWHKRNLPLTQLLLLRVSLLQQILPLSRWFQMSSSWPDSLTTWLFLRTDNPPQPLPPVFTRSVLRENTRLFILPAALVETYTHPTPHHLAWFLWDMAIYVQRLINLCSWCVENFRLWCCTFLCSSRTHLMSRFGRFSKEASFSRHQLILSSQQKYTNQLVQSTPSVLAFKVGLDINVIR